jgi:hypothetical protein
VCASCVRFGVTNQDVVFINSGGRDLCDLDVWCVHARVCVCPFACMLLRVSPHDGMHVRFTVLARVSHTLPLQTWSHDCLNWRRLSAPMLWSHFGFYFVCECMDYCQHVVSGSAPASLTVVLLAALQTCCGGKACQCWLVHFALGQS